MCEVVTNLPSMARLLRPLLVGEKKMSRMREVHQRASREVRHLNVSEHPTRRGNRAIVEERRWVKRRLAPWNDRECPRIIEVDSPSVRFVNLCERKTSEGRFDWREAGAEMRSRASADSARKRLLTFIDSGRYCKSYGLRLVEAYSRARVYLVKGWVMTGITMVVEVQTAEIGAAVQIGDRSGGGPLVQGVVGGGA